ncbi:MAG: hypothetical protein H6Q70_2645 [Firmicutes bacterium]|nr:hypothetical protein [Bacillota bacterium]
MGIIKSIIGEEKNMIQLAKAFSELKDEKYNNSYITKIKLEQYGKSRKNPCHVIVEKETSRFMIISSNMYEDDTLIAKLSMTLFLNVTVRNLDETSVIPEEVTPWKTFSKQEIYDFSKAVGDANTIHLTEKPVVQGLLILKNIKESFAKFNTIEIKFMKPIYAGNPIYVEPKGKIFTGYSNHAKVFQAVIG